MAESYTEIENRIEDACEYYNTCEKPNIAKIAREFDVPEQRLRRRIAGILSKSERRPANAYLSAAGELALVQYAERLDNMSLPISLPGLAAAAFEIRKMENPAPAEPIIPPGNHWVPRFLTIHPEMHKKKQQSIKLDRKMAHDPKDLLK